MDFYSERIYRGNERPFMSALHITLTHLERDYAEGELEIQPDSLNPHGYVHGGCLTALADTVAGNAAASRGGYCVTINNTMNYLRPATGTKIRCTAKPQRVGRTVSVFDAVLTDDQDRTVATGTFTFHLEREA